MTTPLQRLAAEADQLWKEITRADEIIVKLDKPGGRAARADTRESDMCQIRLFFDEATARVHLIEDYMMLLKPEDKKDALIQIAAVHEISKEYATPSDEPHEPSSKHRLASRMLAEATAFLERDSGTSISSLGEAFGWRSPITWDDILSRSRALLDRYHGQIEKTA